MYPTSLPDDAKHLDGEQRVHLARVGVGLEQLQALAPGDDNLLQLGAGEVAVHRVGDAGGALKRQVVQVHLGRGGEVTDEEALQRPPRRGGRTGGSRRRG